MTTAKRLVVGPWLAILAGCSVYEDEASGAATDARSNGSEASSTVCFVRVSRYARPSRTRRGAPDISVS